MNDPALALYQKFVVLIDQAVADKNIYAISRAAEAMGLSGELEDRNFSQRWNYTYHDSEGFTLLVHARWWDQSNAGGVLPDMHVMNIQLKSDRVVMEYEQRYEE